MREPQQQTRRTTIERTSTWSSHVDMVSTNNDSLRSDYLNSSGDVVSAAQLPPSIVWTRRILLGLALLDFVALLLFYAVDLTDHTAITQWVATSPASAGVVRSDGIDTAVRYMVIAITVAHLFITGAFLRLAAVIRNARRRTRIRATILLLVTAAVNVAMMRSPIGGVAQQAIMTIGIILKILGIALLWVPRPTSEFYSRPATS